MHVVSLVHRVVSSSGIGFGSGLLMVFMLSYGWPDRQYTGNYGY
jgi:hypothetical protein